MFFGRDDGEECVAHTFEAQVPEAEAVFKIDEAVADVVGGFDEEDERVPRPSLGAALDESAVVGDGCEVFALGLEIAEFFQARAFVLDGAGEGCVRVFGECAEGCVGELEAAGVVGHLEAGEDAKSLRVTFVAFDVGDFGGG